MVPRTTISAILIFPVLSPRKRPTSDKSIFVIFHTSDVRKKFSGLLQNFEVLTSGFRDNYPKIVKFWSDPASLTFCSGGIFSRIPMIFGHLVDVSADYRPL